MLRIKDIGPPAEVRVTVDPHVPLSLRFGGEVSSSKLYWRALWRDKGLVEVGFHPETGALVTVTLTSIPASRVRQAAVTLPPSRGEGLPRADLGQWPPYPPRDFAGHFIDEQVELELLLSGSRAVLVLGAGLDVEEVWSLGRVRLGLGAGRVLRAVEVEGLSPGELELLALP
jgi:hypothetical protein